MSWIEYDPQRRPIGLSPRDTWESVKRENGWEQLPGETVADMDRRLGTGLSPPKEQDDAERHQRRF